MEHIKPASDALGSEKEGFIRKIGERSNEQKSEQKMIRAGENPMFGLLVFWIKSVSFK